MRGRIDRVERNEETGVLRVLDYKTSGKAKSPLDAHTARRTDTTPDYAAVDVVIKGQGPAQWLGRSAVAAVLLGLGNGSR